MKKCNHCLQEKSEEEFNWRYKALGIRHPTCRECQHEHNKKYFEGPAKERHLQQVKDRRHAAREVARQYVWDYLATHPCEWVDEDGQRCTESNPIVLEFHHLHGKDMPVSQMAGGGYPISTIQAEIDKSTFLCTNCHRSVTVEERGWFKRKK